MKITIHQSLKLKFLLLWHKILSHILFDSHVLTISQCTIPPLTHHFNHVCGYNDENRTIVITVRPIPFYWPRIHQRENVSRNVSLARRQIHLAVALDRANYTSRHIQLELLDNDNKVHKYTDVHCDGDHSARLSLTWWWRNCRPRFANKHNVSMRNGIKGDGVSF